MSRENRWKKPKPDWVRNMEEALVEYYGEPVRPVSQYCDALYTWAKITGAKFDDIAIKKSSYLGRRIYEGERHREQQCPQHNGLWSGLEFIGGECPHNCHLTGWIYEGKDGDDLAPEEGP